MAALAAGARHTCALLNRRGRRVLRYRLIDGRLGDGTTTIRATPGPVSGLGSGVAALAAGARHTCALPTGGGVVCWGANDVGQLGDGTSTSRMTPTPVSGLESGVAAIAAGSCHTCAVTTGGGVLCWGVNLVAQLGDGTTTNRATPTAVSGLGSGVAAIAAGRSHTCALTAGGGVLCWGCNACGELGDGTTTRRTPTPVTGLATASPRFGRLWPHVRRDDRRGRHCWGRNRVRPARRRDNDGSVDANAGERVGDWRGGDRGGR